MKTLIRIGLALVLLFMISNVSNAQSADTTVAEYNQYLISALKDNNIGIRGSAAELLGQRKVAEAVEPLLKMLKTEKNDNVRIVVVMALYSIGDNKALPALKKCSQRDKCSSVRNIARAIVKEMETVQVAEK
jgi:HEAT repeat protein